MFRLLALTAVLIVYGTLYPFHFHFATAGNPLLILLHAWPAHLDRNAMRDALLNIALYAPLGAAACLALARRRTPALGLLFAGVLGAVISAAVEMLQVYDAHRYCSAADWVCNTLGALLGALLALVYRSRIEALLSKAGRRSAPAALLLAVCWAGAQTYPLVPLLNFGRLHAGWKALAVSHFSAIDVFTGAAEWFVFAFVLSAVWGRLATGWLWLAMFAIPARLLIADRAVTLSDLLAGVLALVLWSVTADRARQGVGWLLLAAAILLRELAPFNFTSPPHHFSWVPFEATIGSDPTGAVVVILRKAFDYGAMVWLLRAGNVGYLASGVAMAVALGAMEALQCYLPGRHSEITDSVLAVIMAIVLRLLA